MQDNLPETPSNQLNLTDLVKVTEPLIDKWLQNDSQKHQREIQLSELAIRVATKENKWISIGVFGIIFCVLIFAGILLLKDQFSNAMDIIKLSIGLGGAIFGGYAWGKYKYFHLLYKE